MEKFWASLLVLPMFMWFSFHNVLDRDFKIKQQAVENIVYQYTQIAAKKGILYETVYTELQERLKPFGVFEINVSAEKYQGNSTVPVQITNSAVIGKALRADGYDIINIYVECKSKHPISRLYETTPFGSRAVDSCDIRLFAKASVYIQ